jgi:hypothetical protein
MLNQVPSKPTDRKPPALLLQAFKQKRLKWNRLRDSAFFTDLAHLLLVAYTETHKKERKKGALSLYLPFNVGEISQKGGAVPFSEG